MAVRGDGAQNRPKWTVEPDLEAIDLRLRQRRWRILRAAMPVGYDVDPMPQWVRTPEQFVGWLVARLTPSASSVYFDDLERIAKQTCDLELFRLARRYQEHY